MEILYNFITWGINHIFIILLLFIVLWQGKVLWESFVLQPLRGNNGVVQMDELAKYIMMVLLCWMVIKEGEGPEQVYPESIFWAMVVGAFLIAGVKEFAVVLGKISKPN